MDEAIARWHSIQTLPPDERPEFSEGLDGLLEAWDWWVEEFGKGDLLDPDTGRLQRAPKPDESYGIVAGRRA